MDSIPKQNRIIYGMDLARVPDTKFTHMRYLRMNPKKENEMFARYRRGDNEAKEIILQSHIWDVESIAKEYLHKGLNLPELIQEGNTGLNKAVEKFDVSSGYRFISYAQWWIRQSILQAIQERKRKNTSAYVAAFLVTA